MGTVIMEFEFPACGQEQAEPSTRKHAHDSTNPLHARFGWSAGCLHRGADEKSSSVVEPGATVQKLATGMRFTEGPVWLPAERKVVFSDIPTAS
jgi:hypothetical protein